MVLLVVTSLIGGILGAILLLRTPQETFLHLLPYLLLMATLLFSLSGPITKRLRTRNIGEEAHLSLSTIIGVSVAQFIIAIYGGYFGGGIGILMLAALALMGMENIHRMNALKVLLATVINAISAVLFLISNSGMLPKANFMNIWAVLCGFGRGIFFRE